jgi:hypothetical protein
VSPSYSGVNCEESVFANSFTPILPFSPKSNLIGIFGTNFVVLKIDSIFEAIFFFKDLAKSPKFL